MQLDVVSCRSKRKIGEGFFGSVVSAEKNGTILAIKYLSKEKLEKYKFSPQQEIRLMQTAHANDADHIVRPLALNEANDQYSLELEFAPGGDLLQLMRLRGRRGFTERELTVLFSQMVRGVLACHKAGILHRDLKPDNFVLAPTSDAAPTSSKSFDFNNLDNFSVKLIDFGLATTVPVDAPASICGSLAYLSPEVISGGIYSESSDVWALGVTLFFMATQSLPFGNVLSPRLKDNIKAGFYKPHVVRAKGYSETLSSLILSMLATDRRKRATLADICAHPFVDLAHILRQCPSPTPSISCDSPRSSGAETPRIIRCSSFDIAKGAFSDHRESISVES
eukprot:NODE_1651_length_1342_cov_19.580046_g1368_i0.p1 GENE.NODE_1651_length_1342_cov_19.580046_g1368_i0~~NODE_1651_length_1342_cov_19.580046_g1368_i0.p1  ORF type:complete len:345 (+),score=85.84 NODE_1651_length_1342_cov_19.580046_g1368_i0:27-1037(+)